MQASSPHSLEALQDFLRQGAAEGLINPAAARARRKAVEQLERELQPAEREDIRRIDVGELLSRFHKLEGTSIRPEALELYATRFANALEEYLQWLDNPAGFLGARREKARAYMRGREDDAQAGATRQAAEQIALQATENPDHIVPVPIRGDRVVYVSNLPLDLTRAEAERIAGVILAYSGGTADEESGSES